MDRVDVGCRGINRSIYSLEIYGTDDKSATEENEWVRLTLRNATVSNAAQIQHLIILTPLSINTKCLV
jgi:hypothetical protein